MGGQGTGPDGEVRQGFVAVGWVARPFGLEGELVVDPLSEPEVLSPGRFVFVAGQRRRILACRWRRGRAYLKLEGIDDRTQAEACRQLYLEMPEDELAPLGEGEYYYFQLVGLAVRTTGGRELGRVARVMETGGSNQVLVVRGPLGEVLVPVVDEFVQQVDIQSGVIVVEEVPGLLPETR